MTNADDRWPVATLGDVARLRAIAAGLPGVHLHEQVIEAGFADVWGFVSDLERTTPLFEPDVQSLRVVARDGDRLRVRVRMPRWAGSVPLHLDATMRDGWCWMVARPQVYVIGIAAEPAVGRATGTLLAHMEGVVLPRRRGVAWATAPVLAVSRWRHRFHVPGDVARMARQIESSD
jgi:hypothetical protein